MTIGQGAFLALAVLTVLLVVALLLYYFFFRAYTRERFAFRAFLTISALTATAISVAIVGNELLAFALDAAFVAVGLEPPRLVPSMSDKILVVLCLAGLIYLAITLHKNWPGPISTREHAEAKEGLRPSIVRGTITVARRRPLEPFLGDDAATTLRKVLAIESEQKAWHLRVAHLLPLISQYRVDPLTGWYQEEEVLMATFGRMDQPAAILCVDHEPDTDALERFVRFVFAQAGSTATLMVAIEKEQGTPSRREVRSASIQFRYERELLDAVANFSAYRDEIARRFTHAHVADGFPQTLHEIYVASSGYRRTPAGSEPIADLERYLLAWARDSSRRQIALLGEYGQGKSVLGLKLTYELLFSGNADDRIPILIPLGGRSPRTSMVFGLLAEWGAPFGINPYSLMALHEAGRLLIIFDGFDEMDLVGDPSLRFEHFRTLWEASRSHLAKVMITGRPNFFLDDRERNLSLNIVEGSTSAPHTEALYVAPFSQAQIAEALRSFDDQTRNGMISYLTSESVSNTFLDLISRPSTLFLAATIWNELRASSDVGEINSASIIKRFIQHSYDRQKAKPEGFLSSNEREFFMVGIAAAMVRDTSYTNAIDKRSLLRAVGELFERFPTRLSAFESATERQRLPLAERLGDRAMLIDTIAADVRSSGILVTDLSRPDGFKFAHKSFLEYLIAANAVHSLRRRRDDDRDVLLHTRVFSMLESPSLLVLRKTADVYKFCGEVLRMLAHVRDTRDLMRAEDNLAGAGIPVQQIRRSAEIFGFGGNRMLALYSVMSLTLLSGRPDKFGMVYGFYREMNVQRDRLRALEVLWRAALWRSGGVMGLLSADVWDRANRQPVLLDQ